jgi:hypothetical protein
MHTVWNSRGRVDEVFAKFLEGGYIGVVKIFGGGYTFLALYCIFINKFCKNFGRWVHFYLPLTHPCVHLCWLPTIQNLYLDLDANLHQIEFREGILFRNQQIVEEFWRWIIEMIFGWYSWICMSYPLGHFQDEKWL